VILIFKLSKSERKFSRLKVNLGKNSKLKNNKLVGYLEFFLI